MIKTYEILKEELKNYCNCNNSKAPYYPFKTSPKAYGIVKECSNWEYGVDWLVVEDYCIKRFFVLKYAWWKPTELVAIGNLIEIKEKDYELYRKIKNKLDKQ